jgi:aminoglycoside phosphotransferase (APT) family kinase protein
VPNETRSPTQRALSRSDLDRLATDALGAGVVDAAELSGGGFAAVWRLDLADARRVVVKVGPAPGVPLLRYETGMIAAEADYFRMVSAVPGVPVPGVLHHDGEVLFVEWLPGTSLVGAGAGTDIASLGDKRVAAVRHQLGAAVAAVHTLTGDRFGYTGSRSHGDTWPDAFAAMVEDLLADGVDWKVELPVDADAVRTAVKAHRELLSTVDRPALLHFDLWDGNVLAVDGRLTGLVDGERYLYGDPLLDFVSPALLRRIEAEPGHPFVRGYESRSGRPVTFDESARRRLALYRMHLYLLMVVEMPSRGMVGPEHRRRYDGIRTLLAEEVAALR